MPIMFGGDSMLADLFVFVFLISVIGLLSMGIGLAFEVVRRCKNEESKDR